ncbi:MAG: hypothetical protein U0793_31850 [Gemmataceae bacterium]
MRRSAAFWSRDRPASMLGVLPGVAKAGLGFVEELFEPFRVDRRRQ